jgi:hypothetical protein
LISVPAIAFAIICIAVSVGNVHAEFLHQPRRGGLTAEQKGVLTRASRLHAAMLRERPQKVSLSAGRSGSGVSRHLEAQK